MKKCDLQLTAEIKIISPFCTFCNKPIKQININDSVVLNCSHIVCSYECIKRLIYSSNAYLTDYEETKCLECKKYINEDILVKAFGGRESLDIILADYEENRAAKFTCEMCYETFKVEQGITLDCEHRFCRPCLVGYLESFINERKVSEADLSCPFCQEPVHNMIIKDILSYETYKKLDRFRLLDYEPKDDNFVYFRCPGIDCEYFQSFSLDIESFRCPNCKKVSCPKCRDAPHLKITCEENDKLKKEKAEQDRKLKKEKEEDDAFIIAAKALGFKTCPHCKTMCERISGCNYMRCYSKACNAKKAFCLLCEKPLTEKQHYDHYKSAGPFGKVCNFLDGTPDVYMF